MDRMRGIIRSGTSGRSTFVSCRMGSLLFASVVAGHLCSGQDGTLVLFGTLKDNDDHEAIENAMVSVEDTLTKARSVAMTDGAGRYEVELELDHVFRVDFSGGAHVSKHVLIDLNGCKPKHRTGGFTMNIEMLLFEQMEDMDYSPCSHPIGIARFAKGKEVVWDLGQSDDRRRAIQHMMEQHDAKVRALKAAGTR